MISMNQQSQEDPPLTSPSNLEKLSLISRNISLFLSLVRLSIGVTSARIVGFFIIITNERVFICEQQGSNYSQGWSVIFYILAAMMDCLVMLNDWQILSSLKRDRPALEKTKRELTSNSSISDTNYTIYLSINELVRHFKGKLKSSMSHTIRNLQLIITFYIFGNLALNAQKRNSAPFLKEFVLWVYILSIYFNVFELDLITLETSQGKYVQGREQEEGREQFSQIKQNYIRRIRRPFEVVYILTILLLLSIIALFYQNSLLTSLIVLSIAMHMTELIYEKSLQNRLMAANLALIGRKYLTPYLILSHLTKGSKNVHLSICMANRLLMAMTLMAYLRSLSLEMIAQSFIFLFVNLLFFLGQKLKFNRTDFGKIYLLRSTTISSPSQAGVQCSICLINCNRGDRIVQLPCFNNHRYHYECMTKWFKERKECPLCRHSLEIYDLIA